MLATWSAILSGMGTPAPCNLMLRHVTRIGSKQISDSNVATKYIPFRWTLAELILAVALTWPMSFRMLCPLDRISHARIARFQHHVKGLLPIGRVGSVEGSVHRPKIFKRCRISPTGRILISSREQLPLAFERVFLEGSHIRAIFMGRVFRATG